MVGLSKRLATALIAAVVAVVVAVTWSGTTSAAWLDQEWVHAVGGDGNPGGIGTTDCLAAEGAFATRGEGRFLSGSALGINLDTLAQASGVLTTNNGERSVVAPGTATPQVDDGYSNPLNVVALQAVALDLTGLLELPLNNQTGVLGQYGQAQANGASAGASGLVTDNGTIATAPGGSYPQVGTLRLSALLDALGYDLGTVLSGVTDVNLEIGAVAGRAQLDGCALAWGEDLADAVERDYLAAGLVTEVDSPVVRALTQTVGDTVSSLGTAVNGLVGNAGVATQLLNGVLALVTLDGSLGSSSANISNASINLDQVSNLLTAQRSDDEGAVTVDFGEGTVRIDTAALLERTYPGEYSNGLNGLDPNTNVLSDPAVVIELENALTAVVSDWVDEVADALQAALDAITITASVNVSVAFVNGALTINGTLASIAGGGGLNANGLLEPLNAIKPTLGGVVKNVILGALPTVANLVDTLDPLAEQLVETISAAYTALYVDGLVAVTANAQNDPLAGDAEPGDWAALPDGRYDVAALRIGILDALGNADVRLYLGKGSVGRTCTVADAPLLCPLY